MRNWSRSLLPRLAHLLLVGAGAAVLAFALIRLSPFDPVDAFVGPSIMKVSPEQRALIAQKWGFDQSAATQFLKWAGNALSGDLGRSSTFNQPVARVIAERAFASLALMGGAWLLSGVFGFVMGVIAGARAGGLADRIISFYAYILAGTPTFWIAILLLSLFSVKLGWTPACCAAPPGVLPQDVTLAERLHHMVLPVLTLSFLGVAQTTMHTRAKMIEVMHSAYVRQGFAQGGSLGDVAWRHGARNAALPALTIQFTMIGELFGGSILAEQVFTYPGLGRATVEAGLGGDVALLLAISVVAVFIVSFGALIADILSLLLDPRLRDGVEAP